MAKKSKNAPLAVDAYFATLPRADGESLEALRALIKDAIPHAEERVSYGNNRDVLIGPRPCGIRIATNAPVVLHRVTEDQPP